MVLEFNVRDNYESWYGERDPKSKFRSMVKIAEKFFDQQKEELGSFYGTMEIKITAKHPER